MPGPHAKALPLKLRAAFDLGAFTYTPEKLDESGNQKALPEVTLKLELFGPAVDELLRFVPHVRGDLRVTVKPLEKGLETWKGLGRLGKLSFTPPESDEDHGTAALPLKIKAGVGPAAGVVLEQLMSLRLAMSRELSRVATLTFEVVQPDLPLEPAGK